MSSHITPVNAPSGSTQTPTPTIEIIPVTSAVVGTEYTIVSLGNTTPAQWVVMGSAATPISGLIFTAKAVGVGTGTISYIKPLIDLAALQAIYDAEVALAELNQYNPLLEYESYEYDPEVENPIDDEDYYEWQSSTEGDPFEEPEPEQEEEEEEINNDDELGFNEFDDDYSDDDPLFQGEAFNNNPLFQGVRSNSYFQSTLRSYTSLKTELNTYKAETYNLIKIFTTKPNFLDLSSNLKLAQIIAEFTPKFIAIAQESKAIIKNISDDYKKTIQKRDEDLVAYPGSEPVGSDPIPSLFLGVDGTPINPLIIAPEGARYDVDGDGFLNEEEKKELEYDIKVEKLVNLLTSSLDVTLFIPKYNLTCQQLLNFKELSFQSQSFEIRKYVERNPQVVGYNLSTAVTTVSNISQSVSQSIAAVQQTIKAGKQFFDLLSTTKRKSVKGKIIDFTTKKPIKGALVKYYPKNGEDYYYHQDYTNSQGKFKIYLAPTIFFDLDGNYISFEQSQIKPAFQTETNNPILVFVNGLIENDELNKLIESYRQGNDFNLKKYLEQFIVYVSDNESGEPSQKYLNYKTNVVPLKQAIDSKDDNGNIISTDYYFIPYFTMDIPQDAKFLACRNRAKGNQISIIDLSQPIKEMKTLLDASSQEIRKIFLTFKTFTEIPEENISEFTKPSGIIVSYPLPFTYQESQLTIPYNVNGSLKRNLGIILLKKYPKIDLNFLRKIEDQQNEENLKQSTINYKDLKYYTLEKLAKLYKTLKKEMLPTALVLLTFFGISKGIQAISNSQKEKKKICPDRDKLLSIIKRKNNLVKSLNNTYITISNVTEYVSAGSSAIDIMNASLLIIKNIPIPVSTGVPGTPGVPINTITKISENIEETKKILTDLKGVNIGILTSLSAIKSMLESIITLLNLSDRFITECVDESGDSQFQMETINAQLLSLSLQSSPSPISEINGFKLETETESTTNILKRTRAIAKNNQGIILLTGEYSLTSIKQILIDELVFYIKINDLKAY